MNGAPDFNVFAFTIGINGAAARYTGAKHE